eukprot:2186236-Rhodomonas_salina.5
MQCVSLRYCLSAYTRTMEHAVLTYGGMPVCVCGTASQYASTDMRHVVLICGILLPGTPHPRCQRQSLARFALAPRRRASNTCHTVLAYAPGLRASDTFISYSRLCASDTFISYWPTPPATC